MPFVPMPGAMPRGWSFRQNQNSERTLGENSVVSQQTSENPLGMKSVMESVAELPSESEPYDTPYRDDVKEVIGTKVQAKTNRLPKRSCEPKSSFQSSKQRNKSFEPEKNYISKHSDVSKRSYSKEEPGDDELSYEYETESIPIADASYVADIPKTRNTLSTQHDSHISSDQPTIALFGGSGVTGGHFLTAALDAGYNVRCIPADYPSKMGQQTQWDAIKLGLKDIKQIKEVIYRVDYVVIMLNDVMPGKNEYPAGFLASFVERLYSVLREEPTVQVVLLQVCQTMYVYFR